ncbi:uncharacterized protein V1516DRAFT_674842 [Lipomyces oligophaga]|uniref:uncharacterized protein n=1 Tax=Lipomyces oligophaga TaxID=45792 RepID=UPI0034CF3642
MYATSFAVRGVDDRAKRVASIMDLRTILNETDVDVYHGVRSKRPAPETFYVKHEPVEQKPLIDYDGLIKGLRHDLSVAKERISSLGPEVLGLEIKHNELLNKHESFADEMADSIREQNALETRARQIEKRALRAENEERKLKEQFEQLRIRQSAAERTISDIKAGRVEIMIAEKEKLEEETIALEEENGKLKEQGDLQSKLGEKTRTDYQQESTVAAEMCRQVEQEREMCSELGRKTSGEAIRLRTEQRDFDLSARDDEIAKLEVQIGNLTEFYRRLENEHRQQMARIAVSRSTNGYSSRRTRSPATSTASSSRRCSPATFSNGHSSQNSNSSSSTSGSAASGERSIQQSQKV